MRQYMMALRRRNILESGLRSIAVANTLRVERIDDSLIDIAVYLVADLGAFARGFAQRFVNGEVAMRRMGLDSKWAGNTPQALLPTLHRLIDQIDRFRFKLIGEDRR